MADIRIGVRVSLRGRALSVIGFAPTRGEPQRVLLEDDETGERYVITTRVVGIRQGAEAPQSSSYEAS
jgi:hypothetical protein